MIIFDQVLQNRSLTDDATDISRKNCTLTPIVHRQCKMDGCKTIFKITWPLDRCILITRNYLDKRCIPFKHSLKYLKRLLKFQSFLICTF
jgi:hypothetical protein